MPVGPGKYDGAATACLMATRASAVLLVVINGNRGTGFSVSALSPIAASVLADVLEGTVAEIRRSVPPQEPAQ
jgi:hypothetical protein